MNLYCIEGFDDGPCREQALVFADDPDDARGQLKEWLAEHPDKVPHPQPDGWWLIEVEPGRGVWSVRSAACR